MAEFSGLLNHRLQTDFRTSLSDELGNNMFYKHNTFLQLCLYNIIFSDIIT